MTDPRPAPQTPDGAPPWLRPAERVATVLALAGLWAWAGQQRLSLLDGTPVDVDWGWFLRVASQTSHGQDWVGPAMFMYTTVPSLLFGLLGRVFGTGQSTVIAWMLVGAAAAPLTALAVRRAAGLPAAVVAGLVVAGSTTQIWVTTGLKSPYFVATATALAAVGLAEATARRWWGPFLLAQGATLATSLHLGLAPAGALAVALALLHVGRLPGWRARGLGLAGWALGTLPITGWVAYVDRARLRDNLDELAANPWRSEGTARALAERLEHGLSLQLDTARLLLPVAAVGLVGLVGWWAWRRRRDAQPVVAAFVVAGWTGLQATLLAAAALGPYVYQLLVVGYFEIHHAIGVVPLALVGLAGLCRCVGPPRPAALGMAVAALVLVPWLRDALEVPPPKPSAPERLHHMGAIFHLEAAIRAESAGQDPVVVGWPRGHGPTDPDMPLRVLAEVVRVGRWTHDLPPTCFVLADEEGAALLPGLALLTEEPRSGVWLLHDPGCARLPELQEVLCSKGGERTVALRHDYGGPLAEQALLPACYQGRR